MSNLGLTDSLEMVAFYEREVVKRLENWQGSFEEPFNPEGKRLRVKDLESLEEMNKRVREATLKGQQEKAKKGVKYDELLK